LILSLDSRLSASEGRRYWRIEAILLCENSAPMPASLAPFTHETSDPPVSGVLHVPAEPSGDALGLAHGAGSNYNSPALTLFADAFCEAGVAVLRYDLPFRQVRPHGPPRPGDAERDRAGVRSVAALLRDKGYKRVFLGGHSYGGRQTSMLLADEPELAAGLLLLSYPLHPPRRPEQLRTAHFPKLKVPAVFVHGSRDPFGAPDEMENALHLIPAPTQLFLIEGAGHELRGKKSVDMDDLKVRFVEALLQRSRSSGG
jgi:predicted alpha/beta-hydrolase family hydrolase